MRLLSEILFLFTRHWMILYHVCFASLQKEAGKNCVCLAFILIRKVEENLKKELKDDYVAPKENTKESDRTNDLIRLGIYVMIGMVILGIVVLIGEKILMKKR